MGKSKYRVKMETHDFYCINCGNRGISLMRKEGHQHPRMHRKKLYCPTCKAEVNHIECKNDEDVFNFKIDFENGVYIDEAAESLLVSGCARLGQKHVGSATD